MHYRAVQIAACLTAGGVILLAWPEIAALAAGSPLDAISEKVDAGHGQLNIITRVMFGLVSAALLILAVAGKISWKWPGIVIIVGGLLLVPVVQSWLIERFLTQ